MTKKSKLIEGGIERAIDLNLKKEDVLLLLMEGRKEVLEVEIQSLQGKVSTLVENINKACDALKTLVEEDVKKAIATLCEKRGFDIENIKIESRAGYQNFKYSSYIASKIGDSQGLMKVMSETTFSYTLISSIHATYKEDVKTTLKSGFLLNNTVEFAFNGNILSHSVNMELLKKAKEYKALDKALDEYGKHMSLLTSIKVDYDLFCKGGPRAKAQMIKAALSGDESGKQILDVVSNAAKGVKLLS